MKPGVYEGISNADYHSGPGISKSGLDLIAHCPASYKWAQTAPVDDKKLAALDMGTALHTALLEPDLFSDQFCIEPKLDRRTKAGKDAAEAFAMESEGKIILTADDNRLLKMMVDSVMAHPTARWIFEQGGVNESSIYWNDDHTGELCRVRPDRMLPEKGIIVDVKKVADMSRLERHIEEFRYHVQDAMYSEGFFQAYGERPSFLFLAVSSTVSAGKYPVDVIALEPEWKDRGRELFQDNMRTYAECKASNDWMHIRTMKRPAWAIGKDNRG